MEVAGPKLKNRKLLLSRIIVVVVVATSYDIAVVKIFLKGDSVGVFIIIILISKMKSIFWASRHVNVSVMRNALFSPRALRVALLLDAIVEIFLRRAVSVESLVEARGAQGRVEDLRVLGLHVVELRVGDWIVLAHVDVEALAAVDELGEGLRLGHVAEARLES